MAAPAPAGGGGAGGGKDAPARPIGPDGKPIPGPAEVRQIQAARKMAQQQAQVDEVIGIMHKNVENVLERDRKLGDLEERADALQDGCAQFEKQAAAMKNKFWLENLKMIIISGIVGVIVLGLIYWKFFMTPEQPQNPYGPYGPPPPQQPVAAAPPAGGEAVSDDAGSEDTGGGDAGDAAGDVAGDADAGGDGEA